MISEQRFQLSAQELNCEVAAIKSVAQVEGSGSGFLKDGKTPIILFEGHVFWKELRKRGINPETLVKCTKDSTGKIVNVEGELSDILFPSWGMKPYGAKGFYQHDRLQRAANINRPAALSSASWGMFQILGLNWGLCYCENLQAFLNIIYNNGEDGHLDLFDNYIKATHLDDELRNHDWKGFARGYNGPLYYKQGYHIHLERYYEIFKAASKK